METFTRFGTHNTTHVDAPWHYNSRIRGEPAQTIDVLPLDWFFGPGVVLDMTAKDEGETSTWRTSRRSSSGPATNCASATSCSSGPAATCTSMSRATWRSARA